MRQNCDVRVWRRPDLGKCGGGVVRAVQDIDKIWAEDMTGRHCVRQCLPVFCAILCIGFVEL